MERRVAVVTGLEARGMTRKAGRNRPGGSRQVPAAAAERQGDRNHGSESREAPATQPVLLLGVGNILYGDEGLGIYVVHRLRRAYRVPSELRIIDGGATGWHLEPYISDAHRVVIVDAVAGQLGSIYRFSPHDIPAGVRRGPLRSQELGVVELLGAMAARGQLPPTRIIAMGVTPAPTPPDHLRMGLSPEVERQLPALELVLLAELANTGVWLEPRGRPLPEGGGRARGRPPRGGQRT